jgi:tetratricopeptide (TPR) repeat protein
VRVLPLLLLLLSAPAGIADPGPMLVRSADGLALLERGRSQMIAFRLAEAERTFERLARVDAQSPAAAHHLAKIAWWRAITMEQDELYSAFFERSDALMAQLDAMEAGPWANLFRGEAELHRATIYGKQEDLRRAALALRRGYLSFRRNARDYPEFYESSWGMGICHAAVGSVPRAYRWLLRLFGFRGTVPEGMQAIALSMERSQFYRDEAAVFYGVLDEAVNESREGGLRHLRAVYERHPESPAALYLLGFSLLSERRAEEAERALLRADRAVARPGVYPIPYVDYYLGVALFRQNRFAEAAGRFERFLDRFPGRAHRAQAALHAGLSHEMLGERGAAVRHYRAVTARTDYDSDESARREAELRLAGPMSRRQRDLLLGRNAYDGGRYLEAVRYVQGVLSDRTAAAVERAEAAYRSGRAYQALEEWEEALRHFQFAVAHPGDPLAKWGPWSQFYIGEVYLARGDRAEARQAYLRALAYDQRFEYHKGLEQRTRAALAQL